MIGLGDGGIESANAAEAGRDRDLAHRQTRLINQLFRKMQATGLRHRAGRRAQVLQEQPTQMARANSQALGENFDSAVFQATFADQAQGARNRVGASQPGRGSGRTFRPATQTRTEPGFSRGRSRGKVAHVFFFAGRRRADGAAIDSAAESADEELAVEARIARETRSRTHPPIQIHILHEF